MSYSLNELESMARRATRGAGYPWGLAEEAGKAARWLCVQGLPGEIFLSRLLNKELPKMQPDHSVQPVRQTQADQHGDEPTGAHRQWSANRELCPLIAGSYLSDCPGVLTEGTICLHRVSTPAMLIPFIAFAAYRLQVCVTIRFSEIEAVTDGYFLSDTPIIRHDDEDIIIRTGGSLSRPRAQQNRVCPDINSWQELNRFAIRTYSPATDQSRLLGAGAGLSDND